MQIPFQIYGSIIKSLQKKPSEAVHISELSISGMPQLPFVPNSEMMRDYCDYMHQYVEVTLTSLLQCFHTC